ncbi:DUF4399 domain-containing protein [Candidatus Thiodiazotropha sp. CDECU1]|uniref:DUF4399 domain-containing protein n=1 Tax=Candidatus Thiodiazotropha sp. CDECU1 TaxID=3065865 RepID=UPI002931072C|nr:DUF4399 domain-containing protein [Candidatus Thiodiazotropha sp. CDECU1]
MIRRAILVGVLALLLITAVAEAHSPPQHAKVYFIDLQQGDVVKSPFKVKFGIQGFGITPAGTKGKRRHTAGHHHLLVDVEQLPDLDAPIPSDENHIHFDQGETETVLELPPGRHTLQLLLGDEEHEPQDPALFSEKITITVE